MPDAVATEQLPLSQRLTPEQPMMPDGKPRSQVYSEAKLNNDYSLFRKDQPDYDPNKPLAQKQRELFSQLETGKVQDVTQAWEWMLARKWDEWDATDKSTVASNLTPGQKNSLAPAVKIALGVSRY